MHERSVLIVEDDALLRDLLALALERYGFVVETAANAADARRSLDRGDHDALVIDVDLGPGPNGFDLAEAILLDRRDVALVFLTNLPDPRFVERDGSRIGRGIAYLRKSNLNDVATLVSALDVVLRGNPVEAFRHDRDPDRPLAGLTRKQLAVLRLAAEGLSNAQIAQARGVSPKAVEDTMGRAARALDISPATVGNVRVAVVRRFLDAARGRPVLAAGPAPACPASPVPSGEPAR